MTFQLRAATEADVTHFGEHFQRAHADQFRPGAHAHVAVIGDEVVGWAIRLPNAIHPIQDPVLVEVRTEHRRQGVGTALVRKMQELGEKPLVAKMPTGQRLTADQATQEPFLRSLGYHTFQRCPMVSFRADDPAVIQWCATHKHPAAGDDVELVPGTELAKDDYIAALSTIYQWQHASWAPMAADAPLAVVVGEWYSGSTPERCFATRRAGQITAIVDAFTMPSASGVPETFVLGEAVDPSARTARADVRTCLAATINALAEVDHSITADLHSTDPHSWPTLATLPNLTIHGELHIVELR